LGKTFFTNFARRGAKALRVKYIQIKFFAHFASLREVFFTNFARRGAKGVKGEIYKNKILCVRFFY